MSNLPIVDYFPKLDQGMAHITRSKGATETVKRLLRTGRLSSSAEFGTNASGWETAPFVGLNKTDENDVCDVVVRFHYGRNQTQDRRGYIKWVDGKSPRFPLMPDDAPWRYRLELFFDRLYL